MTLRQKIEGFKAGLAAGALALSIGLPILHSKNEASANSITNTATQPIPENNITPGVLERTLDDYIRMYHEDAIEEASQRYNLPNGLLRGLVQQESSFNPNAESPAGAWGYFQFMPSTMKRFNITRESKIKDQADAAAKFLRHMHGVFQSPETDDQRWKFTLAAYNWGLKNVDRIQDKVEEGKIGKDIKHNVWEDVAQFTPRETQDYVKKVLNYKEHFAK